MSRLKGQPLQRHLQKRKSPEYRWRLNDIRGLSTDYSTVWYKGKPQDLTLQGIEVQQKIGGTWYRRLTSIGNVSPLSDKESKG